MEKTPETPDVDALLAAAAEPQEPARAPRKTKDKPVAGSLLTEAEHEAIKREARERVKAAMKEAEKARLLEEAMAGIRRLEGNRTGVEDQDELVSVIIDVASYAAISNSATGISLNGVQYQHGRTYQVPRHVRTTLLDMMARTYEHQATIEGKARHEVFRQSNARALSAATGEIVPWRDAA